MPAATATGASAPALTFSVFAHGVPKADGIVWTGSRFLYVENTANTIWAAPPAGTPLSRFASLPQMVEETRCVASPGTHGFARGAVYCQTPDRTIYEVRGDGSTAVLARLPAAGPAPPPSDGAIGFDRVGRFGFRLLAATGRSGAVRPAGGSVYSVDAAGHVRRIGGYHGPGGADELLVAPAGFGSAAGDVLLTVDAGSSGGALVAMGPDGRPRTIARFDDGPNPIAVVPRAGAPGTQSRVPAPGLYLTDDVGSDVYYAPVASLAAKAGEVVVGGEAHARFWLVEPRGRGFASIALRTNLAPTGHSLEAIIAVP